MKINGQTASLIEVLQKLGETPSISVEERSQTVALKVLEGVNLRAKIKDLRTKVKRERIDECLVTINNGHIILKDTCAFERGLNCWVQKEDSFFVNPYGFFFNVFQAESSASKAADAIRKAFYNEEKELYLNELMLTSIPPEIAQLEKLEKLDLAHNRLQSIAPEIASLANLKELFLDKNLLKELPSEIFNLQNLKTLDLGWNQLKSIPSEIGNLTCLIDLSFIDNRLENLPPEIGHLNNLQRLFLTSNRLRDLPLEIGNLRNLQELDLRSNQLQTLPNTIGNLDQLSKLDISYNYYLKSLPMNLSNCYRLSSGFEYFQTGIDENLLETIRSTMFAMALNELENPLGNKLNLWKRFAQLDLDWTSVVNSLEEDQKSILYDWLIRLEGAKDFRFNQKALAEVTCKMLFSLKNNDDYRTQFLSHVEANNTGCGDRAAMSFNVLYTFWKTEKELAGQPLKKKLELAFNISKTNALRTSLRDQIKQHEIDQGYTERESVEIELYYETLLKEELGLETAMSTMLYDNIGKKEWISEEQLRTYVLDNAYLFLADMEPIKQQALKVPEVQQKISDQRSIFNLEKQDDETDNEFLNRSESAKNDMVAFENQTIITWAKEILES